MILWGGLVLLGWGVWAARIEGGLEVLAQQTLAMHPEASRLSDVRVTFQGQNAHLTGKVRHGPMRALAEQIVRENLRTPNGLSGSLNPVATVQNDIVIEPLPPGWLILASTPERVDLLGLTGSEVERNEIVKVVKALCAQPGREFQSQLRVNDQTVEPSTNLEETLSDLEREMRTADVKGAAITAQVGQGWRNLYVSDLASARSLLVDYGIDNSEWRQTILPVLARAQKSWEDRNNAEIEAARQAKLPQPHLYLGFKGDSVLVRGIVGTQALKTQIIEAALKAYPQKRVIDQVSISTNRRPVVDATTILLFFPVPPSDEKGVQLAFAVPDQGWKSAPLPISDLETAAASLVPQGFEASLIEADQAALVRWLETKDEAIVPTLKPYLTLAVFGGRVWLRGEVAEEATRTQIVEAVRRAYPNHLLVQFVRLNPKSTPTEAPLQTALSLPPAPDVTAPGILGFAVPGEIWRTVEVTPALLEPNGVSRSGLVPAGPALQIAAEDFSEALDALKGHLLQTTTRKNP